jgi:hypothetical protein
MLLVKYEVRPARTCHAWHSGGLTIQIDPVSIDRQSKLQPASKIHGGQGVRRNLTSGLLSIAAACTGAARAGASQLPVAPGKRKTGLPI